MRAGPRTNVVALVFTSPFGVLPVAILVTCECGQQFQTREENAGRRAKCPDCGRELTIPKPGGLFLDEEFAALEPGATVTSGKAIASFVLGICSFVCMIF